MKKVLLLTLLLLTSITISAQDASNDATWDETIGFLKANISKFDITQTTIASNNGNKWSFTENYEIKESVLESFKVSNTKSNYASKADLNELVSVRELSEKSIYLTLEFTKNSVLNEEPGKNGEKYKYRSEYFSFYFCSKQEIGKQACHRYQWKKEDVFVQSMLKAFQHLAYLNKERRKKSKF